jgi:glycerol-3-phosphate dehydrogenase (NAD(P)+)
MSDAVAVIGAGAWGCALAVQAARAGRRVTLWARDPDAVRGRPRLAGFVPPADLTDVLPDRPFAAVLIAVPVQHLRAVLRGWRPTGPAVVCAKGIEAGTGMLPTEILADLHRGVPAAVLTGPNFAAGIAAGLPAAAVVACPDPALRGSAIALLGTPAFRLYASDDMLGAQLCGAAKNVIAIGAGALVGGGLGENARAALVTRGVAELARLVAAQGGQTQTAYGLAGLGDLLLTCTGGGSRNFSLGLALGQGRALAEVLAERTAVTEGVATAPALLARAGGLDLPICAAVAALLRGTLTLTQAVEDVLGRRLRAE